MSRTGDDSGIYDLFVIGGGINGCGIARDAVGRGLSVALAEMRDLAWATSSASTKLFHGGLRYLEYFEFRLVREALIEREVLLSAMPHIAWPMRFVLPYHPDMRFEAETPTSRLLSRVMPWMKGRRPAWLIRLGLGIYDNMGGRRILPATSRVDLRTDPAGRALQDRFTAAYEYSDCWVQDSRLVALNARDAAERGARVMTRAKVTGAVAEGDLWKVTLDDGREFRARALVNAGGPWVGQVIKGAVHHASREKVRLVRGSHIVVRRMFDHDKCYFLQGEDGRIIFAIPYEDDFTLIGTTDSEHEDPDTPPVCTDEEIDYLLAFAGRYFRDAPTRDDIVWTYSGVRPLYDDGASSATAATRDYVLKLDRTGGAPLLNIFGGKITTYRRLAESALEKLGPVFPGMGVPWTAGAALPGGDFEVGEKPRLVSGLMEDFPFLDARTANRLIRAYGTDAALMLGDAKAPGDLGHDFGAGLSEREVLWLTTNEFARTAEDILWRRTKLGLHMTEAEMSALEHWMEDARERRLIPAA